MQHPSVRFAKFLRDTGRSQRCVARELGVHRSMPAHLVAGRKGPGLRLATAIEHLTAEWSEGPILAVDWVCSAEARAA